MQGLRQGRGKAETGCRELDESRSRSEATRVGGGVEDGERTEAATTQAHPGSTQPSSGTSGSVLRNLSPNSSFYCVRGLRPIVPREDKWLI